MVISKVSPPAVPTAPAETPQFKAGDEVYVLLEYNLFRATVKRAAKPGGSKITVSVPAQSRWGAHERRIEVAKVAQADESIAVIWETWKGRNGAGGYRLERSLYAASRKPARQWPWQGYLQEDAKP